MRQALPFDPACSCKDRSFPPRVDSVRSAPGPLSPVPSQAHAHPASPDTAFSTVSLEQPVKVSAAVCTEQTDKAPRRALTAVRPAHAWGCVRSH